jgi:hypothetical protein
MGWLPFVLNSLLWSSAIVYAGQWWRQRRAVITA